MTTAFVSHSDCLLHDMGTHHPERPARLRAVEDQLIASGLMDHLQHVEAPLARREHLERVHTVRHITTLERSVPAAGLVHLDPDTAMNPRTRSKATASNALRSSISTCTTATAPRTGCSRPTMAG